MAGAAGETNEDYADDFEDPTGAGGDSVAAAAGRGASRAPGAEEAPLELRRHLDACSEGPELEALICDDARHFAPADLQAAFAAVVRVCFQQGPAPAGSGNLIDAAFGAGQDPTPQRVEDFKNMGKVVLARALDNLQELDNSHVATILLAMALLGICVDDHIMSDLVQHAERTLETCSGVDMVNTLAGLAILEYQPEEASLVAFEKRVGALEALSQFDTHARGSLLWSFTRLGRESDVQATFDHCSSAVPAIPPTPRTADLEKVKLKAVFLHSDDLRKTFHRKLQRCPLMMSRRKALPPKHIHQQGSLIALNERPEFSLRFTQPWVVENMQRSQEHKDKVFASRYTAGPMLKGYREDVFRNVRMGNMHKRFVAEDEHLVINPNQTEKDQELRDDLARVKSQYEQAFKEWRSEEHKDDLALKVLAQQLQGGVDRRRAELTQALSDKAAGLPPDPILAQVGEEDELAPSTSSAQVTTVLAKVLWARFPANMFTSVSTGEGQAEPDQAEPLSHFFELWVNGQSMHMRTAGIPWAADCEWYDSFYLGDLGSDDRLELVWKYVLVPGGQTHTGGKADLEWNTIDLDPSKPGGNEVVTTLDIADKSSDAETWGDKLGSCSLYLSRVQVAGFSIGRCISNSLIPPNEDYAAKCDRLLEREIGLAQKRLKEAEQIVEASRALRWQHLDDLQEQHDELVQGIILHRRVFKESLLPPKQADDAVAEDSTPQRLGSAKGLDRCGGRSRVKGSAFAQPLPFYSYTSTNTQRSSIGVFDEAESLLSSLSAHTQRSPRRLFVGTRSKCRTPQARSYPEGASYPGTPHAHPSFDGSLPATPAMTPLSLQDMSENAFEATETQPPNPSCGQTSRRPSSRMSIPSHTFPVTGSATERRRERPDRLETDAVASFDPNPPPLSAYREANIMRKPVGTPMSFPGTPGRILASTDSPSAGDTASPSIPFDLRFSADKGKSLQDQYVHSNMHLPLRKTEGFLTRYLKAREIALGIKNRPASRDPQWDPGPEVMPKNRIVKTWRWDVQPVFPPSKGKERESRQVHLQYRYSKHITQASGEVSAWPRGSIRPVSAVATVQNTPRSASSPRRSARRMHSASISAAPDIKTLESKHRQGAESARGADSTTIRPSTAPAPATGISTARGAD